MTLRGERAAVVLSATDYALVAARPGLVVTRNVRDFEDTGATVLDPWKQR